MKKAKTGIKTTLASAAVIWLAVMTVLFPSEISAAVKGSVNSCLNVLIPSLFAFTAISALLIRTDIYKALGRPFGALSRHVFRLPEDMFPVFLISQTAGYPIGASLLCELTECGKITREDAARLLCFCTAPGPAFICGVSPLICPKLSGTALCIFISVIGANLVLCLVTAFFRNKPEKAKEKLRISLTAADFTAAVSKGAFSMLSICSMVIFMAAAAACIDRTGLLRFLAKQISALTGAELSDAYCGLGAFLEVSVVSELRGAETVPAAAALLSFGGICVYMQLRAICGETMPMNGFLTARVAASALSYTICRLILPFFTRCEVIAVSAQINGARPYSNNAPICSVFLLIMTILLISQKSMVKSKNL